jgi:hypothetical protein
VAHVPAAVDAEQQQRDRIHGYTAQKLAEGVQGQPVVPSHLVPHGWAVGGLLLNEALNERPNLDARFLKGRHGPGATAVCGACLTPPDGRKMTPQQKKARSQ